MRLYFCIELCSLSCICYLRFRLLLLARLLMYLHSLTVFVFVCVRSDEPLMHVLFDMAGLVEDAGIDDTLEGDAIHTSVLTSHTAFRSIIMDFEIWKGAGESRQLAVLERMARLVDSNAHAAFNRERMLSLSALFCPLYFTCLLLLWVN